MQAAEKPEYNEDDQDEAEHAAQPASSVAIVTIVAATTPNSRIRRTMIRIMPICHLDLYVVAG